MNFDNMTLGELETFEEISGKTMTGLGDIDPTQMDARTFLAFALVMIRRENPSATLDDARLMSFKDLTARMTAAKAEPDPE